MSSYLIEQIAAIAEHRGAHGHAGHGGRGRRSSLERVRVTGPDGDGGARRRRDVRLHRRRALHGLGRRAASAATSAASCSPGRTPPVSTAHRWPLERDPFLLETTLPGVFVAGDVRHRSIKRVASAVGEGSMSVQFIHQYLADQ